MFFNGNQFRIALHTRLPHTQPRRVMATAKIGNKFSAQNEIKIKQISEIYLCVESFKIKFDDFPINTPVNNRQKCILHAPTHSVLLKYLFTLFGSYWCIGQWLCSWGWVGNEQITISLFTFLRLWNNESGKTGRKFLVASNFHKFAPFCGREFTKILSALLYIFPGWKNDAEHPLKAIKLQHKRTQTISNFAQG